MAEVVAADADAAAGVSQEPEIPSKQPERSDGEEESEDEDKVLAQAEDVVDRIDDPYVAELAKYDGLPVKVWLDQHYSFEPCPADINLVKAWSENEADMIGL